MEVCIGTADSFSSEQLGERLRAARETEGHSTRAAARLLSMHGVAVTHATLANYEKGVTFPSMTTVRTLATIYRRPVEWFLKMGPTLAGVRYRSLKSVRASEKQAFEGTASAWFQIYVELENILGVSAAARQFTVVPGESDQHAAERLRASLGIGDQPLSSVIGLLEEFGFRVIQVESPARIDGFAGWFGSTAVVALNSTLPNDRIRFNAALELRHGLFEDCRPGEEQVHEDEAKAHNFASHLLMPEAVLAKAFATQSMVRLVQFKEMYGLSLAAMVYRAKAGGHISDAMYQRLWRDFSRLGWRKDEPGQVKPDRPRQLEELIERVVGQGKMSYGDVARIGGLDEAVVRQRVLLAMGGEDPRREGP